MNYRQPSLAHSTVKSKYSTLSQNHESDRNLIIWNKLEKIVDESYLYCAAEKYVT